jgi:hypothetical protein
MRNEWGNIFFMESDARMLEKETKLQRCTSLISKTVFDLRARNPGSKDTVTFPVLAQRATVCCCRSSHPRLPLDHAVEIREQFQLTM